MTGAALTKLIQNQFAQCAPSPADATSMASVDSTQVHLQNFCAILCKQIQSTAVNNTKWERPLVGDPVN